MDHRSELLNAFSSYCAATGLAPATVSTKVMNDGKFFGRVKSGGGFTMETYERAMDWFKANKPKRSSKRKPQ